MDLAFRFLKNTSVSWEAPDVVVVGGITEDERAGVVAPGEAAGLAPAPGETGGGDVSSCAKIDVEMAIEKQVIRRRALIRVKEKPWREMRHTASTRWIGFSEDDAT